MMTTTATVTTDQPETVTLPTATANPTPPSRRIAFIGSSDLSEIPEERRAAFTRKVEDAIKEKATIVTGAAPGADQLAGALVNQAGGLLELWLPWEDYEREWIHSLSIPVVVGIFNRGTHKEAFQSVSLYHPNPYGLRSSHISLHARNYLIVEKVNEVVAMPRLLDGKPVGGTAQGIRVTEGLNRLGRHIKISRV